MPRNYRRYVLLFIKITEDLLNKQSESFANIPDIKTNNLIKYKNTLECIAFRKCLAYFKLRNTVKCIACNLHLVLIAPWWELDNNTTLHVCMRCSSPMCENCALHNDVCYVCNNSTSVLRFDMFNKLELKQFKKL
jgi:hypothetical protein